MKKFKPIKPDEKTVVTLRMDADTLRIVDAKATDIGISRNEIINQMIMFAIDNMDED